MSEVKKNLKLQSDRCSESFDKMDDSWTNLHNVVNSPFINAESKKRAQEIKDKLKVCLDELEILTGEIDDQIDGLVSIA